MVYADYDYYVDNYMGKSISEEDFTSLSIKASAYVDWVTMQRAKTATGDALEAIKSAVCALCEIIQDGEKLNVISSDTERPLSSETVGGWSRSFGSKSVSANDLQLIENRKRETVMMYLAPYGLLQARGYGSCQCFRTP